LLVSPVGGRNAVSAYVTANLQSDKLLLIVASVVFIASKLVLLFISLRNTTVPLAGIQHMFVYLAVESIVIITGLFLTEVFLPSLRVLNDTYPLRFLSILVVSQRLPSPNMWLLQGLDTAVTTLFNVVFLIFIRQVLQFRDFGELTDISRDVDARASLLGARKTAILQGERTLRPARRIAWFNVTRIVLLPVATTLLLVANVVPDPVSAYIIGIAVSHWVISVATPLGHVGTKLISLVKNEIVASTFFVASSSPAQARDNRFESGFNTSEGVERYLRIGFSERRTIKTMTARTHPVTDTPSTVGEMNATTGSSAGQNTSVKHDGKKSMEGIGERDAFELNCPH
jgi:hypothetical protein